MFTIAKKIGEGTDFYSVDTSLCVSVVVHTCNQPQHSGGKSRKRESSRLFPEVQGHFQLHSEFEAILGYMRSCFKINK